MTGGFQTCAVLELLPPTLRQVRSSSHRTLARTEDFRFSHRREVPAPCGFSRGCPPVVPRIVTPSNSAGRSFRASLRRARVEDLIRSLRILSGKHRGKALTNTRGVHDLHM